MPERRSRSALGTEGLYKNRSQRVINVVLLWQWQAENIIHLLCVSMALRHAGIGNPDHGNEIDTGANGNQAANSPRRLARSFAGVRVSSPQSFAAEHPAARVAESRNA